MVEVRCLVENVSTLLGDDIPMKSWQDGGFELPNLYRIFILIILISISFTSFSKLAPSQNFVFCYGFGVSLISIYGLWS